MPLFLLTLRRSTITGRWQNALFRLLLLCLPILILPFKSRRQGKRRVSSCPSCPKALCMLQRCGSIRNPLCPLQMFPWHFNMCLDIAGWIAVAMPIRFLQARSFTTSLPLLSWKTQPLMNSDSSMATQMTSCVSLWTRLHDTLRLVKLGRTLMCAFGICAQWSALPSSANLTQWGSAQLLSAQMVDFLLRVASTTITCCVCGMLAPSE